MHMAFLTTIAVDLGAAHSNQPQSKQRQYKHGIYNRVSLNISSMHSMARVGKE